MQPLYYGAHFKNSPYRRISKDEHDTYNRDSKAGKHTNADIRGLVITYIQDILCGKEIRLLWIQKIKS